MPAKECNVIPLMCDAAIPVLAVANVCSGGRAPTIVSLCYDHNGSCFQILSIKNMTKYITFLFISALY